MTAHRLLLHGTPLTPAVWEGVVPWLRPHGRVTCPSSAPTAAAPDQAALARTLLDRHPGELHVVGHSFGGQVALEMALAAPGRVTGLVLIGARASPFTSFGPVAASLRRGDAVDVEAAMTRWFMPAERAAGGPVVDAARTSLLHADRGTWATALDAIAGFDRLDAAASLTVPVTLIAAGHDPVSGPEAMREIAEQVPGATLHLLPDAAHMSPFLDPEGLAGLVLGGGVPAGASGTREP